jgi:endogenous inhibitor of DNA gyrase (YacG/DUF329 family)
MRTEAELREELTWLINYKKEVIVHFKVIQLSKHKHALLAAFYATIDHEIDLLRWALGEDIVLWRDDMSKSNDMEEFFDSLPPSDFPRKPCPQELVAAARKAKMADVPALFPCLHCGKNVCMASHNICVPCFMIELRQDPEWVDDAANQLPFHFRS